ncbi:hypothetical protein ACFYSH_28150 [Streptomyces sp. NPDC005791]|uniref:hypothetical protein n=1 Tax=Streptomyces sp. NPDC005791 TaxID=3364732 RepID=UPI00367D4121
MRAQNSVVWHTAEDADAPFGVPCEARLLRASRPARTEGSYTRLYVGSLSFSLMMVAPVSGARADSRALAAAAVSYPAVFSAAVDTGRHSQGTSTGSERSYLTHTFR